MIKIDIKNFDKFYYSTLAPEITVFEKERKKIIFEFKISYLIFLLPVFIGIAIYGILFAIRSFLSDSAAIFLGTLLPVFIPFLVMLYAINMQNNAFKKKERYIRDLKRRVYKKLFSVLGLNYRQIVLSEFYKYKNAVLKHFPNKKNFSYSMNFEDEVSGVFKNIPFELCDASLIRQNEIIESKPEVVLFQGLMLAVKLDKSFNEETIVKTKKIKHFDIKKDLVKLEDINFEKHFKVLSDSQIESRYILTTAFMELMVKYYSGRKDKIIVFFDNKCSESKNMFILASTGKDNFEIPFNKSILNKKYYYNLLRELLNMLEIAVALRLGKNIQL